MWILWIFNCDFSYEFWDWKLWIWWIFILKIVLFLWILKLKIENLVNFHFENCDFFMNFEIENCDFDEFSFWKSSNWRIFQNQNSKFHIKIDFKLVSLKTLEYYTLFQNLQLNKSPSHRRHMTLVITNLNSSSFLIIQMWTFTQANFTTSCKFPFFFLQNFNMHEKRKMVDTNYQVVLKGIQNIP